MISSMVANLAGRLEEDPSDREGWKRLVRAYIVLGNNDAARASAERAIAANAQEAAFVAEMKSVLGQLQAEGSSPPPAGEPSSEAGSGSNAQ